MTDKNEGAREGEALKPTREQLFEIIKSAGIELIPTAYGLAWRLARPAPEALPIAWMAEHEDDSKDFVNFYEDVCRQQAEDSGARRVIPLYAAPEALGAAKGVTDEAAMRVALAIIANLEDRRGVLDDVDDEIKQEIAEEIALAIKTKTFPAAKDQS